MRITTSDHFSAEQYSKVLNALTQSGALTGSMLEYAEGIMQRGGCSALFSGQGLMGCVFYSFATEPYGHRDAMVQHMVYVQPRFRGTGCARKLLEHTEDIARRRLCGVILAGSSLSSHDAATAVYEGQGFTTTYAYRKEL